MYQSESDVDQLAKTITTNIRKISQHVKSMQQQSACSTDNDSLRQQLQQSRTYTQQLVEDTNNSLKELSQRSKNKVLKERLNNDYSVELKAFQEAQRKEAERERQEVERARAASQRGNLIELGGQLAPAPGGRQQQPQGGYQQQALMMEEESNLEILREREQAVKDLENNILTVNGIFRDLAIRVHDQGENIDSIEANVDSAVIRVQEGAEQLFQARTHQERARKKKLCLVLSGIVVLAIIITIILLSH